MLSRFRRSHSDLETARLLYAAITDRARLPVFFIRFGVPDTIDGRFDILVLHVFFVMEALKGDEADRGLSTQLARVTFDGFEDALRELGVGDVGISRRIKAMANAFYGRLEAYAGARTEAQWAAALLRNLYRGDESHAPDAAVLGRYAHGALLRLGEAQSRSTLRAGVVDFGPVSE